MNTRPMDKVARPDLDKKFRQILTDHADKKITIEDAITQLREAMGANHGGKGFLSDQEVLESAQKQVKEWDEEDKR